MSKLSYKLIALDLDGTLLTDNKIVTDLNKSVLQSLDKMGIEILIATGRRYFSAKLFAKAIEIDDITILANNGTIVRNISDDKIRVSNYIEEKDFYNLVMEGNHRDLTPITHVNKYHEGYDMIGELEKTDYRYRNYIQKVEDRYRKVDNLLYVPSPDVLAVVFPGDRDHLESFMKKIADNSGEAFNMYLMDRLVGVSPILEIIKANNSKWRSISEYAELKGIKPEEIICVGDDMNDFEMIHQAGLGIAMKNAADGIKDVADIITEHDNNNSGVGEVLREIFDTNA